MSTANTNREGCSGPACLETEGLNTAQGTAFMARETREEEPRAFPREEWCLVSQLRHHLSKCAAGLRVTIGVRPAQSVCSRKHLSDSGAGGSSKKKWGSEWTGSSTSSAIPAYAN